MKEGSHQMYQQQILDHYRNPRRYGRLSSPTHTHTGQNGTCGDEITFDVCVGDDGETIEAVSFTGEGCAISLASASMLAEELPGKTLAEVRKLAREDALDNLGVEILPMRIECALLGQRVLPAAVEECCDDRPFTLRP